MTPKDVTPFLFPPDTVKVSSFLLVLAIFLCSCAGAFSNAMKRGDQYMQAGMWDEAAEAYQRATDLEPHNARAAVKLRQARERQAEHRMAYAQTLAARQDFPQALDLATQAVSLAPEHLDHQQQLTAIVESAVQNAAQAADQGDSHRALDLANRILEIVPHHEGARAIATQVQQRLAQQHFHRAQSFLQKGLQGNALVDLAACSSFVPSFPHAREMLSQTHQTLRQQSTIRVALVPTDDNAPDLTDLIDASLLAASLNPSHAIEVSNSPNPASMLLVSGTNVHLAFHRDRRDEIRSCDWVCGVDHQPNPAHERAERAVADAERRLANEEQDAARIEVEMLRHQREVDQAEERRSQAEVDLDRATRDRDACRMRSERGKGQSCGTEQGQVDSRRSRLDRARQHLDTERQRLAQVRERWGRVRDRVHHAARDRSNALERMRSTPRMVAVDRYCSNSYSVQRHAHLGNLSLDLAVREATGSTLVDAKQKSLEASRVWHTYAAQPGRCPSVGQGPPASLPTDQDLREDLWKKLLGEVGKHVQDHVHRVHESVRASAIQAAGEGRADEAIEGYVRFLVAGGQMDETDRQRVDDLLRRARGIDGIRVVLDVL